MELNDKMAGQGVRIVKFNCNKSNKDLGMKLAIKVLLNMPNTKIPNTPSLTALS